MAAEAPLSIALYHGYELSGSGSNEYTRYLSRALAAAGHRVVLICRDLQPERHAFVARAVAHDPEGRPRQLFSRPGACAGAVTLHQLPPTSVFPVFVKDQQREGVVKAFDELSAAELREYHEAMTRAVTRALADERPAVLHANHLVYQPVVAAAAGATTGVPFYIVPHGSAIEYTIKRDERFLRAAAAALDACVGVLWIAREVRERVLALYPAQREAIAAKSTLVGVGTDTTLFAPLAPSERPAAVARLAALHQAGGKDPRQTVELCHRLDRGEIDAASAYRDAYDHRLPDADLPQRLARIPTDDDWILFVGALTHGKGVQSALAAMPALLRRRPAVRLLIVGSGAFRETLEGLIHALASGNEPLFDELVARGRRLEGGAGVGGALEDLALYARDPARRRVLFGAGRRLRERVCFVGRLDHPRLRHLFPCCRLAVFPSLVKEASPLVFAEALANGVLPCGAYHSGLRDGLDDLRDHLPAELWRKMCIPIEPAARVGGIAEQLADLLDALDGAELAPRLRRLAEERYDWSAIAAALVRAVRRMLC